MKKTFFTYRILCIVVVLLTSVVGANKSTAQSQVRNNSINNYKMPPNWKKHFEDKYKYLGMITSNVVETPQGPKGHLGTSGSFNVYLESTFGNREDQARAIAQAFLMAEKEVLGFRDLSELREYKISTSDGYGGEYTHIYYTRYINDLPINESTVHIVIGPDLTIRSFDASLVPSPIQLYEAAASNLISKEEAILIAEKDLKAMAIDEKEKPIKAATISATSKPPYIRWYIMTGKDRAGWTYVLDAITGDRISKGKQRRVVEE